MAPSVRERDGNTEDGGGMPDDGRHSEHAAVIIGAAQGIGRALAEMLATNGRRLVLADIQGEKLAVVAEQLRSRHADISCCAVDLGDPHSISALFRSAGPIDALACSGAVMHSCDPLEADSTSFERVLAVNLIGNYQASREGARTMIATGVRGSIVVVTSAAARRPQPNLPVYAASKAGLTMALKVLGMRTQEHGVRINTVAPTATRTEMLMSEATKAAKIPVQAAGTLSPQRGINEPEHVAAVIQFLLSPASQMINLREIVVDGGSLIGL